LVLLTEDSCNFIPKEITQLYYEISDVDPNCAFMKMRDKYWLFNKECKATTNLGESIFLKNFYSLEYADHMWMHWWQQDMYQAIGYLTCVHQ
jgi:hypothetical protein